MCVFGIYEQSVGEGERVSPVRGFRGQASQISSKVGMLGWGVALKVTCSLKLFDWSVRVEPWSPQARLCFGYMCFLVFMVSLRVLGPFSSQMNWMLRLLHKTVWTNQENSKDKKVWIWLMPLFFFFHVWILLFALTVQSVRGLLQAGVTDSNHWNNYSHNAVCEQCLRVSLSGVRSEHSSLDKCHWKTPLSVSPQTAGGKSFLNRLQPALIQTTQGLELTSPAC